MKKARSHKSKLKPYDHISPDSDETFAFIVGYTSGGFPYGITHEEMDEIERNEKNALPLNPDIGEPEVEGFTCL
jgi:hypothetical protein